MRYVSDGLATSMPLNKKEENLIGNTFIVLDFEKAFDNLYGKKLSKILELRNITNY